MASLCRQRPIPPVCRATKCEFRSENLLGLSSRQTPLLHPFPRRQDLDVLLNQQPLRTMSTCFPLEYFRPSKKVRFLVFEQMYLRGQSHALICCGRTHRRAVLSRQASISWPTPSPQTSGEQQYLHSIIPPMKPLYQDGSSPKPLQPRTKSVLWTRRRDPLCKLRKMSMDTLKKGGVR